LAVILISLAVLIGQADAQDVVRRAGVQDLKYKVGQFSRASRLTVGGSVSLDGFTPINALAFGVDNTGATACNDSLNALIDSVGAWGGGVIYLPAGDYSIDDEIVVDHDNITLMGDGMKATVITPTWNARKSAIEVVASDYCTITGLGVRKSLYTGADEAIGIAIRGGKYNTVSYCWADSCDDSGIHVGYDWDAYFALDAEDTYDPSTAELHEIDGFGHAIIGNLVTNTIEGTGIEIMRADSLYVVGNTVNTSSEYSVRVDATYGTTISGNVFTGSGSSGISVQGYGDAGSGVIKKVIGLTIADNVINGYHGVVLFNGATDIVIDGNAIKAGAGNGIMLDRPREQGAGSTLDYAWQNVLITNNSIMEGNYGFFCHGQGDQLTIAGNAIGEFYEVGIYFNFSASAGVVTAANISGNRIWINDRAPTTGSKYGFYMKGDSCYVNLDRNQYSFPAAASYQIFNSDQGANITKYLKVSPHSVADFGVYGAGSAQEISMLDHATYGLFNMAGADSSAGLGVDLYFPSGSYVESGTDDLLKPVRAVGPGVPSWLQGGLPRVITGAAAPTAATAGPVGSIYQRWGGAAGTSVYVKESATSWVPIGTNTYLNDSISGEMYKQGDSAATTFAASATDSIVGAWDTGGMYGMTFGAASRGIVAPTAGTYFVRYSVSCYAADAGNIVNFGILKGGTRAPDSWGRATVGTDVVSISGEAFTTLTAGQIINLCVQNETDTSSITVTDARVVAHRVK